MFWLRIVRGVDERGRLVPQPLRGVFTRAAGMPAASAVMPSADQRLDRQVWTVLLHLVHVTPRRLRPLRLPGPHGRHVPLVGVRAQVLREQPHRGTPSTRAWWVLWYIAATVAQPLDDVGLQRPLPGRRVLCSREVSSSSSRIRPGFGSALCRTWCSMSNCSSSSQTHCPAVRIDRCGRFRYSGAMSSTWRISSYIART